ncbi:MAG: hypothetical protein JWM11_3691 [Planctomycetaceae bacterium]|nr:hypothetical protein [Planctomycetaceae bacterium]
MSIEKLNVAIEYCIAECMQAANPLACLASFCLRLRELHQLDEAEIWAVDVSVRHILKSIMVPHLSSAVRV